MRLLFCTSVVNSDIQFNTDYQEILSRDSVTVTVDAVIYYRVSNPTMVSRFINEMYRMSQKLQGKKSFCQITINYRVFNNEGQKVLGYKTMKKCAFEATKRLIASKNMGHFVIFVICLIISNKIYILKYMKKCTNLAKFDIFL